nr:hypothetical protein Itr_chr13CG17130 [Ipomoea trifida]
MFLFAALAIGSDDLEIRTRARGLCNPEWWSGQYGLLGGGSRGGDGLLGTKTRVTNSFHLYSTERIQTFHPLLLSGKLEILRRSPVIAPSENHHYVWPREGSKGYPTGEEGRNLLDLGAVKKSRRVLKGIRPEKREETSSISMRLRKQVCCFMPSLFKKTCFVPGEAQGNEGRSAFEDSIGGAEEPG